MADQKRVLDEWDVDVILDAARTLVRRLSDGQKKRLRAVDHTGARHSSTGTRCR